MGGGVCVGVCCGGSSPGSLSAPPLHPKQTCFADTSLISCLECGRGCSKQRAVASIELAVGWGKAVPECPTPPGPGGGPWQPAPRAASGLGAPRGPPAGARGGDSAPPGGGGGGGGVGVPEDGVVRQVLVGAPAGDVAQGEAADGRLRDGPGTAGPAGGPAGPPPGAPPPAWERAGGAEGPAAAAHSSMLKSGTPQPPKLKLLRPLQLQLATGSLPERSHRRDETCNSLLPSNRRPRWPPSVPPSQAAERLPRVRAARFW